MSTLSEYKARCALCGRVGEFNSLGSVSQFGEPDLDGRPAEFLRGSIWFWVDECGACGYANTTVDKSCLLSKEELHAAYTTIPEDKVNSRTRPYAKLACLRERIGDIEGAAIRLVHAAWFCDDDKMDEAATYWRRRAAALTEHCIARGWAEMGGEILCLRADLYRRAGDFGKVSPPETKIELTAADRAILDFQLALAAQKDAAVHSMDEVPGYNGNRDAFMGHLQRLAIKDAFRRPVKEAGR